MKRMIGCIKPQYYIEKMQIEYSKFKDNLLKIVEEIRSLVKGNRPIKD